MRRTALLVPLAAAGLLLSACGGDDDTTTPTDTGGSGSGATDLGLISDGQLTVCSDIPYEPFEFEDADAPSGYSGFDIDLMQAIAENLELELVVTVTAFDALSSGTAVESDACDVAASAMTITEEREENITFADAYYDSLQSLLVPEDSDVASIDDLGGKKVGVQSSTTGQIYAEENAPEDTEIVEFPGDTEMYAALQAGSVDALLQDLPVNLVHVEDGGLTIAEEYQTDEQYGFALKKEGKEALVEAINEQLQALRDDGTYDEIYGMYFTAE
jgi:polar amino acid transport system substrate-binding protein